MSNLATAKNTKSWSIYCRENSLKNIGGGKALFTRGYDTEYYELQRDGSVSGYMAPQPTSIQKQQMADAYHEIVAEKFPTLPVPKSVGMPPTREDALAVHEYRDENGDLLMCVERFLKPDGNKQCLPWFYYEGTGWECKDAPEGFKTPLYGNHHNRSRVMIHEGEKAVDAAIAACELNSDHPWADFLRLFGHCTWKGGAILGMPGRADWRELDDCDEVWLMPDNDGDGYRSAQSISNQLRCKATYCVHWGTFGNKVPKKWDIADPCPDIDSAVLEQSFDLYERATVTWFDENGKAHEKLNPEFAKKFAYINQTEEFVELRRPSTYYTSLAFNNRFGRLSKIKNLAGEMSRSRDVIVVDRPGYLPIPSGGIRTKSNSLGVSPLDGESYVNMYRPPLIREREPKDTVRSLRPFLTYVNKVFPNPMERKIIIRWLCHNLTAQSPEERVPWAVLMVSVTEGTGKSTLGNLVRRLIGGHNVSKVEGTTLSDKFTGWLENKQLIVVEELKEERAFRLTESLKAKISEPTISVRRMNTDPYETDNFISLLASSNHLSAISLGEKDRRWFVPKVTEDLIPWNRRQAERYLAMPKTPKGTEFFEALWKWFNDEGDRYLLWYLRRYGAALRDRGWQSRNNHPPVTETKESVISRSKNDWQLAIDSELTDEKAVCLQDVVQWLKESGIRPPRPDIVGEYLNNIKLPRLFRDPGASDPQMRHGRVYLLKKPKGGYVVGYIHGNPEYDGDRKNWNRDLKPDFNWLSDKFKGLAANEGASPAAEGAETDAF